MRVPLRPRDICALIIVGAFAMAASGTHVVRSGDTLGSIAQRNGTTVQALVAANGIANPNLIVAGTTLKLPGSATDRGSSAGSHTVRVGDTLASIAARYGTTVSALADANGISNPNLIVVGRSLQVQGSARPSTVTPSPSGGRQLAGQRHTVQRGDTIGGIAARYGIRTADLVAWNGLVDGKLYATTRLVLFNPGTLPAMGGSTTTPGGTHVVQAGQSLSSIASRYGVSAASIAKANGISDPNRIRVGQTLTIPGSSDGGGGFVCPVPGGTFFNDWGFPRSGGRSHAGTDVFAPRGTPVRAPAAGHVSIATGTLGGKQFRLTTPAGIVFFGTHLDSFGSTGQVRAGDVVGTVGDSGNARGGRTQLHFEVHPSGSAVNPFPLLSSSC